MSNEDIVAIVTGSVLVLFIAVLLICDWYTIEKPMRESRKRINESKEDNKGYKKATPLELGCEYGESKGKEPCGESKGDWYQRLSEDKDNSDWDSEPIYLCEKHSINHKK